MVDGRQVVIVGGGIGGAALASALARDGHDVTVLEASVEYEDRVRGESMVPWGVAEADELGVLAGLRAADATVTETWVHYDALVPTEASLQNRIPAGMMRPGVPGSMNLRHPEACTVLARQAIDDGCTFVRGVTDVQVTGGPRPSVTARNATGAELHFAPSLVVGADGRASTVRRQLGIQLERHEATHMIAGMLVDGLDDVELDHDFLATTDDLFMATFRQHCGQLRIYLCPGMSRKNRFAGPDGRGEFLRSANFPCLPFGDRLAQATPIGPLATFPGDDTWTARPYAEGAVLIGDSAGYNSPIIGQGLSIVMRDARLVRDALRSGDDLPAAFEPYAMERLERMRRLRNAAIFQATTFTDDCDNRPARRARFFEMMEHEPLLMGMLAGLFAGPEHGPAESFDGHLIDMMIAA